MRNQLHQKATEQVDSPSSYDCESLPCVDNAERLAIPNDSLCGIQETIAGEEVDNEDIVKGYKVDTDTFIEVTKEELENVALESTRTIEIDEFVDRTETEISDPPVLPAARRQGRA